MSVFLATSIGSLLGLRHALELGVAAMLIVLGFRNLAVGPAGAGAVTLLVLATVPTVMGGFAYLGVFGVGTILGMTVVTALLAAPTGTARGGV